MDERETRNIHSNKMEETIAPESFIQESFIIVHRKKRCECQCKFMNKYVIMPNSRLRQSWDVMTLVLLLYTILVLPIKLAFVLLFFF